MWLRSLPRTGVPLDSGTTGAGYHPDASARPKVGTPTSAVRNVGAELPRHDFWQVKKRLKRRGDTIAFQGLMGKVSLDLDFIQMIG